MARPKREQASISEETKEVYEPCSKQEAKDRWHTHTKQCVTPEVWAMYAESGLRWEQVAGYWVAVFTSKKLREEIVFRKRVRDGLVIGSDMKLLSENELVEFKTENEIEAITDIEAF